MNGFMMLQKTRQAEPTGFCIAELSFFFQNLGLIALW